jgi:hypothetical protein
LKTNEFNVESEERYSVSNSGAPEEPTELQENTMLGFVVMVFSKGFASTG